MRSLFLLVLMLAGCAAPANHGPQNSPAKTNVEPPRREAIEHPRNVATPAAEETPQQFEPQQEEKPEFPLKGNGWFDISGKNRDDSELFHDSAACQIDYKQALSTARQLYPEPLPGKDGTRNAQAVTVRQQNIRNYSDAAYTDCMAGKGWRRKQASN